MNEAEYKFELHSLLEADFEIIPEANGIHLVTGEKCRADFLCRPNPLTKEKGFDDLWFVIECKSPEANESMKKCLDGLAQTLSYRNTDFGGVRPEMGFLFPPIKEFLVFDNQNKYSGQPDNQTDHSETVLLRRFLERLNIGEIHLCPRRGYEFRFSSNRFFDPIRGRSKIPNLGRPLRVGSRKLKRD